MKIKVAVGEINCKSASSRPWRHWSVPWSSMRRSTF